jgi:hypothetical protein
MTAIDRPDGQQTAAIDRNAWLSGQVIRIVRLARPAFMSAAAIAI